MLQPFEPFKEIYLNKLPELKKRYLVSQTYIRAFDHFADEHKTNLLLTDYGDLPTAKTHLNAVRKDKYGAIIDLEYPGHRQKLIEMMAPDSPYNLFWAVVRSVKELETQIDAKYKEHMRRYIETRTNWQIGRDTTLRPSVQVIFGELFIILKYNREVRKVKFEEIENS